MKKKRTGWKSSHRANLLNKPPEGKSWMWMTQEMLESPTWRAMSFAARKIIDRLIVEHLAHAGTENGNLISTYSDFEKFEIRRKSIPPAIVAAEVLGFIDVIKRGGSAFAEMRSRRSIHWHGSTAKTARRPRIGGKHSRRWRMLARPSAPPTAGNPATLKNKKPGAKTPLLSRVSSHLARARRGKGETSTAHAITPTISKTDDTAHDPQQPSCRAGTPEVPGKGRWLPRHPGERGPSWPRPEGRSPTLLQRRQHGGPANVFHRTNKGGRRGKDE